MMRSILDEAKLLPQDPQPEFWTEDRRKALLTRVELLGTLALREDGQEPERSSVGRSAGSGHGLDAAWLAFSSDLHAGVPRRLTGRDDCAWCGRPEQGIGHLLMAVACAVRSRNGVGLQR